MTPFDPDLRDYLTALRDLLAKGPPSWPVMNAVASLCDVLVRASSSSGEPARSTFPDFAHEAKFLRERLGEVERART